MQPYGEIPELLNRQIDGLEAAIDLSRDWLEIQDLIVELDKLNALYEDIKSEAASAVVDVSLRGEIHRDQQHIRPSSATCLSHPRQDEVELNALSVCLC